MSDIPVPSPRVAAFERLAFGMFVHWGLYSQMEKGEWVEHAYKIPPAEYLKLMDTFTAEDFDARKLVRAAKRAGMNYITHTTRHHEGFSLYDTRGLSKLDVTHTPAKRDLAKEFIEACREEGLVPMLYHTTLDWNDPRFKDDFDAYLEYLRLSVEVLCTNYGPIGGLWFDGNWSKKDADWKEGELYATIRRHQPEAIIINNTGVEELGQTGHPEIDCVTYERGRPTPMDRRGKPKYIAGEMCHTMNFHWGVAKHDYNMLSPAHVITELCFSRRAGANLLMNIGPEKHGALPAYETAALAKVGDWIELHGGTDGPIYHGKPCGVSGSGEDFALQHGDDLYLFITELTATGNTVEYGRVERGPGVRQFNGVPEGYDRAVWMDNGEELQVDRSGDRLDLTTTRYPYGVNTVVRVAKLSK